MEEELGGYFNYPVERKTNSFLLIYIAEGTVFIATVNDIVLGEGR